MIVIKLNGAIYEWQEKEPRDDAWGQGGVGGVERRQGAGGNVGAPTPERELILMRRIVELLLEHPFFSSRGFGMPCATKTST